MKTNILTNLLPKRRHGPAPARGDGLHTPSPLTGEGRGGGGRPAPPGLRRSHPATASELFSFPGLFGTGEAQPRADLGRYYANSVSVYAAIKLRADAVSRPILRTLRPANGSLTEVTDPSHPVLRLAREVNPWSTPGDLWRATEIHLNLWGSAFWSLEGGGGQPWQIWPLRPDRVRVLPDPRRHVRGFVYQGPRGPVAYAPEEIVWLRYFNPLEEYAGMSPLTPARLSVDMGRDAMRFNRDFFRNSAQPDFVMLTDDSMTDAEIADFYDRWEARYQGGGQAHRPAIANFIRDIKTLGFNHREMDFIQGLRWSLEEVSRAFGVPKPLLADLERATFANINAAERLFWRNTIVPELKFIEEQLTRQLLPRLGYPELKLEFDLTSIEALQEDETQRVNREVQLLDRGVVTINELRRQRGLPDVPWGNAGPAA